MQMKNTFRIVMWTLFLSANLSCSEAARNVLVLGSGGLIGSALVEQLATRSNVRILHVLNRQDLDLRVPNALEHRFNQTRIDFVFFLACEVGGSKFLENSQTAIQHAILLHNLAIYQTVFPFLHSRNISFVFSSSYLEMLANSYGTIKRLGEQWIRALNQGKIARLWNIYGYEPVGLKSHVIPDFIEGCLKRGKIDSIHFGAETRQFLHVEDTAKALLKMMDLYEEIEMVTDISSGKWIRIDALAKEVAKASPRECRVVNGSAGSRTMTLRKAMEPRFEGVFHRVWRPEISLREGIQQLYSQYSQQKTCKTSVFNADLCC